ncbi:MAG: hypothetical protein ACPGVD_12290, partial [Flavobacteriales bacterium]
AQKGDLNHSNNPTYLEYAAGNYAATSSQAYLELTTRKVKNICFILGVFTTIKKILSLILVVLYFQK